MRWACVLLLLYLIWNRLFRFIYKLSFTNDTKPSSLLCLAFIRVFILIICSFSRTCYDFYEYTKHFCCCCCFFSFSFQIFASIHITPIITLCNDLPLWINAFIASYMKLYCIRKCLQNKFSIFCWLFLGYSLDIYRLFSVFFGYFILKQLISSIFFSLHFQGNS